MSISFHLEEEVTCPLGNKLSGSLCGRLVISFIFSIQFTNEMFLATGWITMSMVSLGMDQRPHLSPSVYQASFLLRPTLRSVGSSSSLQQCIVQPLFVQSSRSRMRYFFYFLLTGFETGLQYVHFRRPGYQIHHPHHN